MIIVGRVDDEREKERKKIPKYASRPPRKNRRNIKIKCQGASGQYLGGDKNRAANTYLEEGDGAVALVLCIGKE